MTDTRSLLNKITELRQRLEKGRPGATVSVAGKEPEPALEDRWHSLKIQLSTGREESSLLAHSVGQIAAAAGKTEETKKLPTMLTARARAVFERSRDLLRRLRALTDVVESPVHITVPDPLPGLYRETTAMMDTSLRVAQNLPGTALDQFRTCEGIEAILSMVQERLELLESAIEQRQREQQQVTQLAEVLLGLEHGKEIELDPVTRLAEQIVDEVNRGAPLRLLHVSPERLAEHVACHSLNVARVIARLVRHQPDMRERRLVPVTAALLHDAGMLGVPAEIVAQASPLSDAQRRAVESHCRRGAELAEKLLPSGTWLATAAAAHHERLDGTGYPDGLQSARLDSLTRLLTVCDLYAAMCSPRPHRPARDPRAVVTDILLLAEQGVVDKYHAECLLHLSFYPEGCIVELADGAVARVVACHPVAQSVQAPARPVLAVLSDPDRSLLPLPRFLDLAQTDGQSIVRALAAEERVELLGHRYPEWV